jgi:restriction system protein
VLDGLHEQVHRDQSSGATTAATVHLIAMSKIPPYTACMNPILRALRELGGSGTIQEISERATTVMGLTEAQLAVPHGDKEFSEVAYRMAWARTYLKNAGLLDNSSRGVWTLTQQGQQTQQVDERWVVQQVRKAKPAKSKEKDAVGDTPPPVAPITPNEDQWREDLLNVLRAIDPAQFERLCQRVLRESGFVEVNVSGRSGDGGIDGTGILRLQGMVSFHVLFQCKRWQGPVGSSVIRDFRGAMVGRADKGLVITTGSFTRDAQKEATRDGAPAIDLVDGEQLTDLLRNLNLGVRTQRVEKVIVEPEWFKVL